MRKHPLERLPYVVRFIPEVAFLRALLQCEITAEIDPLPLVGKVSDRRVADPRDPAHAGLDLPRLHAVAADLHHSVHAAGHHNIAVRQPLSHVSGMENAVPQHLLRLLRHVDIAPEEGVVKADFPLFAVRHFLPVFAKEPDLYVPKDRLSDGRDIVAPVDDKLRHMKTRFAHAVIVDQLNIVKIYPVRSFTPRHQCLQAAGHSVRHHAEDGGRQKGQIYLILLKFPSHLHRILSSIRAENHKAHAGIERVHEYFDSGDEAERRHLCHAGRLVDQVAWPGLKGSLIQFDLPVLLQNALGLSRAAGCINGKTGVVRVRLPVSVSRLCLQDLLPCGCIDHQPASAVLADCLDPLRRVVVLHHRKGSARLPDSQHRYKGARVAREPDHDKIFHSDPLCAEPPEDPGGQFIHLLPRVTAPREFFRNKGARGRAGRNLRPLLTYIRNIL